MLHALSDNISKYMPAYPFYSAHDAACVPPIMIIGCGRSGNTLLRAMLVAGGDVTIPPESYVLSSIARRYNLWRFLGWGNIIRCVIKKLTMHPEFQTWSMDITQLNAKARAIPKAERSLLSIMRLIYLEYGQQHGFGQTYWGDKTPLNTLYLPEIHRIMPNAKYVHIIRDPRAVALSYVKAAENNQNIKEDSFEKAAQRWYHSVAAVRQFKKLAGPQNIIEIRFEDLLAEPEAVIKQVCAHLGLNYNASMLAHHQTSQHLGDVDQYDHHTNSRKALDPSKADAWQGSIAPRDRMVVEEITGVLAKLYGYV